MILSGAPIAEEVLALVKKTIADNQMHPKLAVVQVGEDAASDIYVSRKMKVAESVGIAVELTREEHATTENLIAHIQELNEREDVNAILVQLPLPKDIDADAVIAAIDPHKDVDGFHPQNIAAYTTGRPVHTPVLIQAIEWLLGKTELSFKDKQAVVIGKSDVFMQPVAFMLAVYGMNVSWIKPADLDAEKIKAADVVIVAIGSPHIITGDMIKPDAVVIDIGINRTEEGKVVGDVDYAAAAEHAAWITPTPGGVGPVTIAAVMWNTLRLTLDFS